jgi:hypothetical protein
MLAEPAKSGTGLTHNCETKPGFWFWNEGGKSRLLVQKLGFCVSPMENAREASQQ